MSEQIQITLDVQQIKQLAETVGLEVDGPGEEYELGTEVTLFTNRKLVDEESGESFFEPLSANFTEYPEEGAWGLWAYEKEINQAWLKRNRHDLHKRTNRQRMQTSEGKKGMSEFDGIYPTPEERRQSSIQFLKSALIQTKKELRINNIMLYVSLASNAGLIATLIVLEA